MLEYIYIYIYIYILQIIYLHYYLLERFPSSQKYSEQYTKFRKQIASFFRWNH